MPNPITEKARAGNTRRCRTWRQKNLAKAAANARAYRARTKNPKSVERSKMGWAHNQVKVAISKGLLHQQACEICGTDQAVAHHHDYDLPLDVTWLCFLHHKAWHRLFEAKGK